LSAEKELNLPNNPFLTFVLKIEKIIDKRKIIGRATRLYKNIRKIIMIKPYLHY
tara:strand:- start:1437 stop:1598 length:162 start_codon:yes stop_codon:yes gene_type:complete